ncbi:MAG: carboxypeptidase-like regulatory domain-containing protein [Cyclobacteriaceae bacterium]|jgi:hypothetical protein|nr:carboxypeptidase-like regulatory domain-containing protein [Cyclobacteriaceae bacterium]
MKYKIFKLSGLLFGLLILSNICIGQQSKNQVKGVVTDSLTHELVPYANVYFANTSIGTSTNEKGEYSLAGFADGKYDLTISSVGFKLTQYPLEFSATTYNFSILLPPEVKTLSGILVKPDTINWQSNYNEFRRYFIGLTNNARKVEIENKRDLHLFFDTNSSTLYAHCKVPLIITNKALGYRVRYQLLSFYLDYRNGTTQYAGIPLFENLKANSNLENNKWIMLKEKSYQGSFTHLINTLYKNKLAESSFEVFELHTIRNKERPNEAYLKERIDYWRKKKLGGNTLVINKNDSLSYYLNLKNKPEYVDSVGKKIKSASEIITYGKEIFVKQKGKYKVTFNEREEIAYAQSLFRAVKSKQESIVYFLEDNTIIYQNGYYEPIANVLLSGYLGWSEKIAELLPLDYKYEK